MTQQEFFQKLRGVLDRMLTLAEAKNQDYAEESDALQNFRLIERLTNGRITKEDGVLVRMSDKLARMAHLLGRESRVANESLEDTTIDLAVYSAILAVMLQPENEAQQMLDTLGEEMRQRALGNTIYKFGAEQGARGETSK